MNIAEANAVDRVLRHFLRIPNEPADLTPGPALAAAVHLADRANAALHAGLSGDRVRAADWRTSIVPDPDDQDAVERLAEELSSHGPLDQDSDTCICGETVGIHWQTHLARCVLALLRERT